MSTALLGALSVKGVIAPASTLCFVLSIFALLAATPVHAQSSGAGNCERFKDPHAYNLCLASSGPRARTSGGSGALPDLGYAPAEAVNEAPAQRSDRRAGEAPRRVSNSPYLNLGAAQKPRARQTVRIPRR